MDIVNRKTVTWMGIILTVIFCLAPVMWQLLTSFKTNADIASIPAVYFPSRITLEHYLELFTRRPFALYIFNSFIVSFISTVLCLILGSPAAYVLTRIKLKGENVILSLILIVSLFPYILLFLGLLEVIKLFGLGNNYLSLIIPYTGINLPLTILILRSFFKQLPKDLEDSAKIDGYNIIGLLINIILPLTAPAIATTGILTFIFAWNEYIFALTFITKESLKTVPVALAQLGGSTIFEIPYGPIAAGTVLATLPLVILVLIFQRRIVQGLTAGAVKG